MQNTLRELCDRLAIQLISGTYTGRPEEDAQQISAVIEQELTVFLQRFDVRSAGTPE